MELIPIVAIGPAATAADWALVAFTALLAMAAIMGFIGFLLQRQTQKLQFGPVIRIDVGPGRPVQDWSPPSSESVFERDQSVRVVSEGLGDSESETVYAWIENQRPDPGAAAMALWVTFKVTLGRAAECPESFAQSARLIYLEPGRTARVQLLHFPRDIPGVRVEVDEVLYRSRAGHESGEVHGRLFYEFRRHIQDDKYDETMLSAIMRRRWRTAGIGFVYNGVARRFRRFERHKGLGDGEV